jgi:hypothetical protein
MELVTEPAIDQQAGLYAASVNTVFEIKVYDEHSGIKSVEISIDGSDFTAYTKPFKLPIGRHDIRCKAADIAGNINNILSGKYLSGGATTRVMIDVQ